MPRFLQYTEFGGPEVLELIHVDKPTAGPGEIVVRVRAVGLNPVDFKIFRGPAAATYGATPPTGVANDYSGVVEQIGEGVTRFAVGDAVLGGARNYAMADFLVTTEEASIVHKPTDLSFEQAAALPVVGRTAWATVESLSLTDADTVFVSAAAGGVGGLAVQLAKRKGATVVGTASESNHEYLRSLGVIPVAYGDGLVERLRAAAPQGYTAALDNHGTDSIDVALELGIPIERINTIAVHGPGDRGAAHVGGAQATNDDLLAVAELVASGDLDLPISGIYPLERAAEAYDELERGHVRGKLIVVTD
ncbi:NADPH:quinone reductase-like Zn-dependent oxidoreductase [Okibacterium sp. HSC-33S16]|uniref:NADP-dependent oxidoreductase n=1 Tax=Okibacterium sp. HSC-33S16 TaxID=2910965 RepID=UPI0020A17F22|nr:NADP-dependent oxidoreductase [Okibacterium sp. HSC-33S16]MCP2031001.1 NADPH:quinone reductase-like Zn-dependent oxidoreductase [Okibacterium sp. HSC-33S16]